MNALSATVLAVAVLIGADGRETASPDLSEAVGLLEAGQMDAGRARLKSVIDTYPGYLPAYVVLARSFLDEDPQQALVIAREVLRIDPDDADALDILGTSYARARTDGLARAGERKLRFLEIGDYKAILEQRPDHADVLYRAASQQLALERLLDPDNHTARRTVLNGAVDHLAHLRAVLGDDAQARLRAGAHFQSGRAIKHVGDLEKELGQDPGPQFRDAIGHFEAALALEPERVDALGEIVLIRQALGDDTAARDAVTAHLDRVEQDWVRAKVLSLLGNLEIAAGNRGDGMVRMQEAIALSPKLMDAYVGLYRGHHSGGDDAKALAVLADAVAADPNFILGHLLAGQTHIEAKRYDDAIAAFERALRIPPERATTLGMRPSRNVYRNGLYYQAASRLAWLYLRHRGDATGALAMAERAQTFAPAEPYLLDTIGSAHVAAGAFDKAKSVLQEALSRNGQIASAHYHLAQALHGLGDDAGAKKSLATALSLGQEFMQIEEARSFGRELDNG